jgi:hypothetical protein
VTSGTGLTLIPDCRCQTESCLPVKMPILSNIPAFTCDFSTSTARIKQQQPSMDVQRQYF